MTTSIFPVSGLRLTAGAAALLWIAACGQGEGPDAGTARAPSSVPKPGAAPELPEPQRAFMANLAAACGQAFRGRLVLEPEGDEMLTGSEELLVHFRDCEPGEVRIPFHIEIEATGQWDRSRTWYVMVAGEGLELRHDHRRADGAEDDRTWYGGFTTGEGTATRQDFASPERTAAAGMPVGWRIEIEPGHAYRYGTTLDGQYDWMIEFDLGDPITGDIPPAWGWETPPSRIPGPP